MDPDPSVDVTQMLAALRNGDRSAEAELLSAVYAQLRALARYHFRRERGDHTLNSTALVHEVYCKLVAPGNENFLNRSHFFALASRAMRRILVDHARGHLAAKRGGGAQRVVLSDVPLASSDRPEEILAIHTALDRLATFAPRQAQVVEMRFFGGMSEAEIAEYFDLHIRTIRRDWDIAKSWLYGELKVN